MRRGPKSRHSRRRMVEAVLWLARTGCQWREPDRTYRCEACWLVLDRDVNAAVNLARWPDTQHAPPQPAAA